MRWIDTHCHLDATEFSADIQAVRQRAREVGVACCIIPAVHPDNFSAVRNLAHANQDAYCLGIHPLYVANALDEALGQLHSALQIHREDTRLLAVGEIGLDLFVPELAEGPLRDRQELFYREQLKMAKQFGLPVVLHVRRSADRVLKHLRDIQGPHGEWSGVAHAFNGSEVQAREFIKLGFKLGFGGAVTFERAQQLRRLATTLPLESIVLETDAPDIAPHWLYVTAEGRAQGLPQGRNEPGEIPRIAQVVAHLRGMPISALCSANTENACVALPRLRSLLL